MGPGQEEGLQQEHPLSRSLARPDSRWKCSWMQTGWGALGPLPVVHHLHAF